MPNDETEDDDTNKKKRPSSSTRRKRGLSTDETVRASNVPRRHNTTAAASATGGTTTGSASAATGSSSIASSFGEDDSSNYDYATPAPAPAPTAAAGTSVPISATLSQEQQQPPPPPAAAANATTTTGTATTDDDDDRGTSTTTERTTPVLLLSNDRAVWNVRQATSSSSSSEKEEQDDDDDEEEESIMILQSPSESSNDGTNNNNDVETTTLSSLLQHKRQQQQTKRGKRTLSDKKPARVSSLLLASGNITSSPPATSSLSPAQPTTEDHTNNNSNSNNSGSDNSSSSPSPSNDNHLPSPPRRRRRSGSSSVLLPPPPSPQQQTSSLLLSTSQRSVSSKLLASGVVTDIPNVTSVSDGRGDRTTVVPTTTTTTTTTGHDDTQNDTNHEDEDIHHQDNDNDSDDDEDTIITVVSEFVTHVPPPPSSTTLQQQPQPQDVRTVPPTTIDTTPNNQKDRRAVLASNPTAEAAAAAATTTTTTTVVPVLQDHPANIWPLQTIRYRRGTMNGTGSSNNNSNDPSTTAITHILQGENFQIILPAVSMVHDPSFQQYPSTPNNNKPSTTTTDPTTTATATDTSPSSSQYEPSSSLAVLRSMTPSSSLVGTRILRGLYTIFTLFWTVILLVFAWQVLLLTFTHVAIDMGLMTTTNVDDTTTPSIQVRSLGTVFAIVPLVKGFSYLLSLAGCFVADTFRGNRFLFQLVTQSSSGFPFSPTTRMMALEWTLFLTYFGFPLCTLCMGLFVQSTQFWEITALTGIIGTMVLYWIFVLGTLFHQVYCFYHAYQDHHPDDAMTTSKPLALIQKAIHLRQLEALSGVKRVIYASNNGGNVGSESKTQSESEVDTHKVIYTESVSLFSKLTTWSRLQRYGWYDHLTVNDNPEQRRIHEMEDVMDIHRYVTSMTWSLDQLFCKPLPTQSLIVLNGPHAVTNPQLQSSTICATVGVGLVVLVVIALVVYLSFGKFGSVLFLIVSGILLMPQLQRLSLHWKSVRKFVSTKEKTKECQTYTGSDDIESNRNRDPLPLVDDSSDSKNQSSSFDGPSDVIKLSSETYRITVPTERFAWLLFVLETLVFFVWPVLTLLSTRKASLAFFVVLVDLVAKVSSLSDTWRLHGQNMSTNTSSSSEGNQSSSATGIVSTAYNPSQVQLVAQDLARRRRWNVWRYILVLPCLVGLVHLAGTIAKDDANPNTEMSSSLYLTDWEYPSSSTLAPTQSTYASCDLTSYFDKSSPLTFLSDLAFLASTPFTYYSYQTSSIGNYQQELNNWFGLYSGVQDHSAKVQDFRRENGISTYVSFNLVTAPTFNEMTGEVNGEYAYVLIQGPVSPWQYLGDLQIWSATVLFRFVQILLPLGDMWTPIVPYLVRGITSLEGRAMTDLYSSYKATEKFVQSIQAQVDQGLYEGMTIIGYSMGGGLAFINGAQNSLKSFALSAPNVLLTRKSLDPAVSAAALDQYTFNVIPERDVTSLLDHPAKNVQEISCQSTKSDNIWACGNARRTFCEIAYSCGGQKRPVPCDCALEFGYPVPVPVTNNGSGNSTNTTTTNNNANAVSMFLQACQAE
jgi:hypothetical protein